jgi:protein involved in polysaccharide export with SLBB domain
MEDPMPPRPRGYAILLSAALLALAGCTKSPVPESPMQMTLQAPDTGPYRVQPGDVLDVKFQYHPTEDQRVTVRADGGLTVGIAGDVMAAGLTGPELEALIRTRAARFLRDPMVTVGVVALAARAYIGGEVANAGFVGLAKPMTVLAAIMERGGFTRAANMEGIYVISPSKDVEGNLDVRQVTFDPDAAPSSAAAVLLSPEDIVVVSRTGIANANLWVEQWIDGLTPEILRGVRFPTVGSPAPAN